MTRNIIILVAVFIIIVLLAYYFKSSSLSLDEKGLKLEVQDKTFYLESTVLKRTPIMFSNVDIMRYQLSDGTYFEVATVDDLYEFNSDVDRVIKAIFKAEKLETLFSRRGVKAMQVTLENSQVINLFVEDTDSKSMKIHYGIAYDNYLLIVKKVMGKEFKVFPVGGLLELPAPMTHWDVVMSDINAEIIMSIDY
ncbi:MAG TPA: hypothetical protein ENK82_08860 [Campylobacterales bacterium]|nr:hypothetical protein [Campylobacterales bacterium]HHS93446.1 hypothetical protein [Campylobacterales bacterium]